MDDGASPDAPVVGGWRPRPGLIAVAVGAGLLAAGALAGLDATSPRPPEAQPQPAQAQATTPPGRSNEALPGASVACSVVGRLERVAVEDGELWGRLQNTGAVDAAPGALELGWSGEAILSQVVVREASGDEIVLFEGERLGSPAFVSLPDAPTMAPGAMLEIGLRFEVEVDGTPWVPGPVVVHLAESCRTVLAPIAPAPHCDLELLDGPRPATDSRETVELRYRGVRSGGQPRRLVALEASWPVEANGALVALEFNGRNRLLLDQALTKSPATVPLDRLLGRGFYFIDGEEITIGLVFAKPVAEGPYNVTLAAEGCDKTATTWLANPRCGLTAREFRFEEDVARLQLQHARAFTVGLSSLALFWPESINGALIAVALDGRVLWEGKAQRSPASIDLPEEAILAASSGAELSLRFAGAPPTEGPGGASGIARAAYTLVVETAGGCRTVFSERERLDGCDISAGPPIAVPESKALRIDLSNAGGDAVLRELALAWNADNGSLTDITLGGKSLIEQPMPHSTLPLTLPLATDLRPLLARNSRAELWLEFENAPAEDGYLLQLSFDGADGSPCQELLISRPQEPRAVEECPFELTDVRVQDLDVLASLLSLDAMRGGELVGLNIEWPRELVSRPLTEVALLDLAGAATVLWSGSLQEPPLAVDVKDVLLLPGTNYTLRLRFAGLIGNIDNPGESIRIALEFADGCQIVDRAAEAAPPKRELIEGVLQAPLPRPLLSCCWRILRSDANAADGASEVVLVEADQRTRVEPDAVTPRPGDMVSIDALSGGGDRYYAERIRFIRYRPPERLVGTIDKISPDRDPATDLPTWISLHGRRILIVDRTTVKGEPRTGTIAVVEGERNPDGSLTALSIVVTGGPQAQEFVEIKGIVNKAVRAQDVQLPDLRQLWSVGRYDVRVMQGTVVTGGSIEPDPEPPRRGTFVRIYGTTVPETATTGGRITLHAHEIEIFVPAEPRIVQGVIEALPEGSLVGSWKVAIQNESGADETVTFEVGSLAVVDTHLAPAEVGLWVRARLDPQGGGRWQALDVETDWEE